MGLSLILTTDDCRTTYEELKAKGVEFLEEPTEQPYGIDCGFRDPFGNQGRITQPASEGRRSPTRSRSGGPRPDRSPSSSDMGHLTVPILPRLVRPAAALDRPARRAVRSGPCGEGSGRRRSGRPARGPGRMGGDRYRSRVVPGRPCRAAPAACASPAWCARSGAAVGPEPYLQRNLPTGGSSCTAGRVAPTAGRPAHRPVPRGPRWGQRRQHGSIPGWPVPYSGAGVRAGRPDRAAGRDLGRPPPP
jgi:hypothetical protein